MRAAPAFNEPFAVGELFPAWKGHEAAFRRSHPVSKGHRQTYRMAVGLQS
jgi:hypothetical protein